MFRTKPQSLLTFASAAALALSGCGAGGETQTRTQYDAETAALQVLTPEQIEYIPLNPDRGDAAPQAGTLWGNIREDEPSGVLLRFADGFSSPPHIHNITYRAVVIEGMLHNDDPDAAKMWMGPGSFWIQPAGEAHITEAKPGSAALSFLEILEGPYLVKPTDKAFDNGERALNLDATNMVWSDFAGPAEIAYLWGEPAGAGLAGMMLKIEAGASGALATNSGDLKAVVIGGVLNHQVNGLSESTTLPGGGYFASKADVPHTIECEAGGAPCLVYTRTAGTLTFE